MEEVNGCVSCRVIYYTKYITQCVIQTPKKFLFFNIKIAAFTFNGLTQNVHIFRVNPIFTRRLTGKQWSLKMVYFQMHH